DGPRNGSRCLSLLAHVPESPATSEIFTRHDELNLRRLIILGGDSRHSRAEITTDGLLHNVQFLRGEYLLGNGPWAHAEDERGRESERTPPRHHAHRPAAGPF